MRGCHAALARRAAGVGQWVARGWWQLAHWLGVSADQPVSHPQTSS